MEHKTCLHTLVLAAALLFAVTGTAAHAAAPEPAPALETTPGSSSEPAPELNDSGKELDPGVETYDVSEESKGEIEVYVGQEFTVMFKDTAFVRPETHTWTTEETEVVSLRGGSEGYRKNGIEVDEYYGYFKAGTAGKTKIKLFYNLLVDIDEVELTVVVKPVPVDVTLTANAETCMYDGQDHSMKKPVTISAVVSNDDQTPHGKAMYEEHAKDDLSGITATSDGWPTAKLPGVHEGTDVKDSQVAYGGLTTEKCEYTINKEIKNPGRPKLTITKKPVTVTMNDAVKSYGDPDPEFTYTVDGIVAGDVLKLPTRRVEEGEELGEYAITVSAQDDDRYEVKAVVPGKLTIVPLVLEVQMPSETKVYDGTPLQAEPFEVLIRQGADEGKVITLTPTNSITNVSESPAEIADYEVDWGGVSQEHYQIKVTPGTLTIKPKPIELHVKGTDQTLPYTGSKQSAKEPYFEQVGEYPADVAAALVEYFESVSGTDVGDYPIYLSDDLFTLSGPAAGNYSASFVVDFNGCLHIVRPDPSAISKTVTIDGWTYGEKPAAPKTAVTFNGAAIDYSEAPTFTYAAADGGKPTAEPPKDAGRYTVTAVWPETENLPALTAQAEFTVAPRLVTLTSGNAKKVYDGQPLTESNVVESVMGWATGDGAEYTVTGSQKNAGSSANTFTYTLNEGTKAENYQIKQVEGTLTVTRCPATIYAQSVVKEQGKPDEPLQAHVTGVVEGETLAYTIDRDPGEDPGKYVIHISTTPDSNPDYRVTTVDGVLTILPAGTEPDAATQLIAEINKMAAEMNGVSVVQQGDMVEYLHKQSAAFKNGMAEDAAVRGALGILESVFEKAAEVTVTIESGSDTGIESTYVSQVGAAFNADLTDSTKYDLTLQIEKTDAAVIVPGYDSALTVDIKLLYSNGKTPVQGSGTLAVPVCITLPLPESITDPTGLLIYHYHGGAVPEVIRPVVFKDDEGRWMARFCTDSFSVFDFVLPKPPAPAVSGPNGNTDRTDAVDTGTKQPAALAQGTAYSGTVPQTADTFPLRGAAAAFVLALAGLAGLAAMRGIRRRRR